MKKRLEAELISIAHRVLKLKNKSEVDQLYLESKKLYETLTILKFYGDNFEQVKATLPENELEEKLALSFEEITVAAIVDVEEEKEIIAETYIEKAEETIVEVSPEIIEPIAETVEEIIEEETSPELETKEENSPEVVKEITIETIIDEIEQKSVIEAAAKPDFELTFDSKLNENQKSKTKTSEIIFDDFLGPNYADPVFIKPEELAIEKEIEKKEKEKSAAKTEISSDKNTKGITIGLNDRVAFMKHLFANSSEDYNRVLSQLITFDTYHEAQTFIAEMVKPDYSDWKGKEDYEVRFMEIVERKFS